jgi:hypothetical protein
MSVDTVALWHVETCPSLPSAFHLHDCATALNRRVNRHLGRLNSNTPYFLPEALFRSDTVPDGAEGRTRAAWPLLEV